MFHDLLDDRLNHVVIGLQQIVAAHPRLARKPGGNHYHVASRGRGIVSVDRGNARRARIRPRDWPGFHHVQRFTRRRAFQNVRQHHIRQLLVHNSLRRGRTHESAAHHRHFFSAHSSPLAPIVLFSANPLRSRRLRVSFSFSFSFLTPVPPPRPSCSR